MRGLPLNLASVICIALGLGGLSLPANSMDYADKRAATYTEERSAWISVRMNDINDPLILQQELDLIRQGNWSAVSASSIALLKPIDARLFHPPSGTRSKGSATTARDELALYFSMRGAPGTDVGLAIDLLRSDPAVMHTEPVVPIEMFGSSCQEIDENEPIPTISGVSTDWHLDAIDAPSAWNIQRGHATVGIADTGAYASHPALADFIGTNYNSGNLHSEFGFQTGDRSSDTRSGWGHPFDGKLAFGHIDEVEYIIDPNDGENCGYSGSLDFRRAGHGTHVTGLISAREAGLDKPSGACPSCPTITGNFTFPWTGSFGQCAGSGQDPWTGAVYDVGAKTQDFDSVFSTIAFLADLGAQVINFSGGSNTTLDCGDTQLSVYCKVIEYLQDREVMLFASAGNQANGQIDFPARDPRVFGVSGTDQSNALWKDSESCGSNTGSDSNNSDDWPHFAAPSHQVYSTMYPDRTWIGGPCHVYNDGNQTNAYGYCTGTSMASPLVAGVASLLRSADPLATPQEIFEVMRDTADNSGSSGQNDTYGWGRPQARMALNHLYGTESGVQLVNSTIPLFRMYSPIAEDNALTTKPQMAVSLYHDYRWDYNSYNGSALVTGYPSFPDWSNDPPSAPAADILILSGHNYYGHQTRPLYLMSWVGAHGGNPDNGDFALVASHNELETFKSNGYTLRGKVGYLVAPCSPEPNCIPSGMTWVYRAYNPDKNDHLVVPLHLLSDAQSEGYDEGITMLGYSYIN